MSDYKVEENVLGTTTSHPSYGTLEFNRKQCNAKPLFGSSTEHRNIISMTLRHAEITRG